MQEYLNAINDPHFNTFAGILSIAMSPRWRMSHAQVASVRGRLDAIAQQLRGFYGLPESKRSWFTREWSQLLMDIKAADPSIDCSDADMDWLVGVLDGDPEQAKSIIVMMFAVACSHPRWFSCEELSEATGLSAETWKKRAASGDWHAHKAGKTWIFPELFLRAHGILVPPSMRIETE